MTSYRFALLTLLALPALAGAQSRTALAISGGPVIPLGELRKTQTTGTNIDIRLIRGSDDVPFGVRFDFGYDKLKGRSVNGVMQPERRIVSGTAGLLLSFAGYGKKPYVLAGAGAFKVKINSPGAEARTRFGYDFGLGVTVPVGAKAAFIEARLTSITQLNAKPIRYAPIVFGFLF